MKTKFYLFSVAFLLFVYSHSNAQSKKAFIQEAEKAFAQKNYNGALVYYDEALAFDKNDAEMQYKTAEAARLYNAYGYASSRYLCLIDTLKNNNYPDAICRLGEMYHKLGRYDDAIKYYQQYLSEYSNTDMKLTALARTGIASATKAKELVKMADANTTITRLGEDINSPDADFGASDMKGRMYFSSLRYDAASKALKYKQIAKTLSKSGSNPAAPIAGYINDRDKSVANFSFNLQGTKVFYSICEYVNGWNQNCEIYASDIDADGNLSNEVKLNENINLAGSNNTQPAPGLDLKTGLEVLYFVSDRPGGSGGKDIWYSVMDGNNFGSPSNLTSVNTEGDEITPFFHIQSNVLYFSSDGREGFGGFDIFNVSKANMSPQLLNAPTNTSMNDMYYFLSPDGKKGYLTSNREGSAYQYESYEACCMDIYSLDIKNEITLDVLTFLQTDGSDLNGTTICLYDDDTGKEIECLTNTELVNKKSFILAPNKNYKIVARKNGYTTAMERFRTTNADRHLTKKLYLAPDVIKLEVFTFENPSKRDLIGTTVTLTDLTDGSVKEIVITNALGNDYKFDVIAGRKYKLTATKNGYTTAMDEFSTVGVTGTIRKDLYLEKAQMQDLLPISLYFDNDFPDNRSRSPRTKTRYENLVVDYLNRKPVYLEQFTKPLSGVEKQNAVQEIETFFDSDVRLGNERFMAFLSELVQKLESGEKVELEIRGFASPRSNPAYNKTLSKRRIHSISNEMVHFQGGILKKYLKKGLLKLTDVSYGDTMAKPNVIGDLKDERNSIYNINAARERRVEILRANIK
jgi:tetratricopeptide (TPR) repeat protein/outer membrane protein OmpA-like peptidoglycan-associated protein